MRINGLLKADKHSEAGVPASKELLENLGRFIDEVANAGVLYTTDGLQPSAKGARFQLSELF
jgi:hypothetical protein